MLRAVVLTLLAVELGAGFGTATATGVSTTEESMIVEIHVEVDSSPDSVVVHFALADEDTVTIPLVARDDGTYGVTTELKPADYGVVFEVLGDPGSQSEAVTLTELGVDLDQGSFEATDATAVERSPGTQRWLWLGVALAAASLSALAFWVLGGRDKEVVYDDGDEPDEEEDVPDKEASLP